LNNKNRDGSLAVSEDEERFQLITGKSRWQSFLDWASVVKIPLRPDPWKPAGFHVAVSPREVALYPGAPFEVICSIKNRAARPVITRLGHWVRPDDLSNYLECVQCGLRQPLTIRQGAERQYSGIELLHMSFPKGVRPLSLTYDFRLLK